MSWITHSAELVLNSVDTTKYIFSNATCLQEIEDTSKSEEHRNKLTNPVALGFSLPKATKNRPHNTK